MRMHMDLRAMLLGDLLHHRQAQAGAVRPGGEEGLEHARPDVVADTGPVILHAKMHPPPPIPGQGRSLGGIAHGQGDHARAVDGVDGVDHQVEQQLLQLVGVRQQRRDIAPALAMLNGDALLLGLLAGPQQHVIQHVLQAARHGVAILGRREAMEGAQEAGQAVDLVLQARQIFPHGWRGRLVLAQHLDHGLHARQGVANFMGQAHGQLPQGVHLLPLEHLTILLPAFVHEPL